MIGTGLLLAAATMVKLLASEQIALWAFVAACLIGVAPVARRAFAALRAGIPFTIEGLMTIAAVGALFIGAAKEAALVVFLFAVGEVLEGVAADRARASIRILADLVPKTALVEENGVTREIDAATLEIGQVVLVRPGDRIPADGTIAEGSSGIDESPVTGESMPKTKGPGDAVFAGSINAEAALRVTVTKSAEDNTISRIIALVEEAESARAPTERFIDHFSRYYMPAITGLALLVAVIPPLLFGQPRHRCGGDDPACPRRDGQYPAECHPRLGAEGGVSRDDRAGPHRSLDRYHGRHRCHGAGDAQCAKAAPLQSRATELIGLIAKLSVPTSSKGLHKGTHCHPD